MPSLQSVNLQVYTTLRGVQYKHLRISYQVYGCNHTTAPVVVVFHGLTGNSDVADPKSGWWKGIIGDGKVVDTNKYAVISFNILGNGYDGTLINKYKDFVAQDIASISYSALLKMGITHIHSVIGGSLGGAIAWELALHYPQFSKKVISVAADWKSTDWIMGLGETQEQVLLNSQFPIEDARKIAMLFYRSPQSLKRKFNRERARPDLAQVNSWLNHHGNKLNKRFKINAYLMMNHLLSTIDYMHQNQRLILHTESEIIQIGINSDMLFPMYEMIETQQILEEANIKNHLYEIKSEDGHDAFLIEQDQIAQFLKNHY